MKSVVKVVFGLGNPGVKYRNNRHNIGYMIIDKLSKDKKTDFKRNIKVNAYVSKIDTNKGIVLFIKPLTFMNNSGICVKKTIDSYGISKENFLIIYDDVNLPLGVIRFRGKGSCGGQRGMDSIIEVLGESEINRLKIGIRGGIAIDDLAEYVLSDFKISEQAILEEAISKGTSACMDWVNLGSNYVMRNYNRKAED